MATKAIVSSDKLKAIADAIRAKTGNPSAMLLDDMPVQIASITGGGTDTRFKDLVEDALVEINDDTLVNVRTYAFYGLKNLVSAFLPNATSLGGYVFYNCTKLVSVDLPSFVGAVPAYSFTGCSLLQQVNVQNAQTVSNYAFQNCTSLTKIELNKVTSIGLYVFRGAGLTTLIIRNNTAKLTVLTNTNSLTECPIGREDGYIYFPKEYVESYKTATNWSTFASQIRAIEDYPEITGG